MNVSRKSLLVLLVGLLLAGDVPTFAADWLMLGRDATRNAVSPEPNAPLDWDVGSFHRRTGQWVDQGNNIRWKADLGIGVYASPVISDGLVWIGANSQGLKDHEGKPEAALLRCFRETDGKLLYEYVSPRIKGKSQRDPPWHGLSSSPSIQSDRLWFCTNRCETVCLDISPLKQGTGKPEVVWTTDLKKLGIHLRPLWMWPGRICSPSQPYDGRIYVTLPNGVDDSLAGTTVPAPEAPSLVCLNKDTGEVLWTNNSAGANVLYSEFSSPLVANIGRRGQVIVAQGDGWVRSFEPDSGKLIWQFDGNSKLSDYTFGRGTRNYFLATPVLYENRIYIGNGRQASGGEGPGRLICIDPTKNGDISSELAVDAEGNLLPRRRFQAVDAQKGEKAIPNPNSGLIWEFAANSPKPEDQMHRTLSSVAIQDGLVIAPDYSGLVHCLDARSGKKYWTYDRVVGIWASPLIVGDSVYIADEEGMVSIFRLSQDPNVAMTRVGKYFEPIAQVDMGSSIRASPVFVNDTLYVCDRSRLFAIAPRPKTSAPSAEAQLKGQWPQWRGPNRDNVSLEANLLKSWPAEGPPLVWNLRGIGEGIASVAVAGGRIYTLGYVGESEYVTALDQRSGKRIWAARIGEAVAERSPMRWLSQRTPTVDDDRLYAYTSRGQLICLSVPDGQEVWRRDYLQDFGAQSSGWGLCDYPLVDGERLICRPGGSTATIVALNKFTGEVIWKSNIRGRADWSATLATDVGGIRHFVTFMRGGLVGVAATDGRLLWKYEEKLDSFNACTPLLHKDYVFCSNGRRGDAILLKLASHEGGVAVSKVYYQRSSIEYLEDSSVLVEGHLYAMGRAGRPLCLKFETGELIWSGDPEGGSGRAGWTFADGHLYQLHANGRMALVKATPRGYDEQRWFMIPGYQPARAATLPVVAGRRLYVRNDDQLFCYDVSSNALEKPRSQSRQIVLELPGPDSKDKSKRQAPRSVFVPTPIDIVEKMLQLADVKETDLLYDLGSGDGRIVITAAKNFGCKAVGYEIEGELVELSRNKAKEEMVESKVSIVEKDIHTVDLSRADVITVYLVPKQLEALVPQLRKLKPGSRVVSHQFTIPEIEPDQTVESVSTEDDSQHTIHLWTAPLGEPHISVSDAAK